MEGHLSLPKTLSMNIINQLNAPPQTTALQKVFILIGLGTFVALVALTASLPLPLLHNQSTAQPPSGDDYFAATPVGVNTPGVINFGDTAFLIVATAAALSCTPALAWLYSNIYGRSTSFSVQVSLLVAAMISVLWIIISFSLVYAKDANNDQILGFPKYYYMFAHVGATPDNVYVNTVPFSIFAVFELAFPVLTAAIVVNALIDRVNVYGLMFFMFVWHLCFWSPIAHIMWNIDGFFHTNKIEDSAGGLVVHMTAGVTAVTAHLFLDWTKAPKAEPRRPNNPENLVLGAIALWFFTFFLNAGKVPVTSMINSQSIVNTIGCVMSSIIANYFLDVLHGVPVTDVTVTNSILIGLVASAPCCNYVTVGGAMTITMITMLTVRVFARYLLKETLDDTPYTIGTLHGLGGSIAFIFTGLLSYAFVNPLPPSGAINGLTWGQDILIRHHTAATLALWICGFCALLVGIAILNFIVPLSKSVQTGEGDYAPTPLGPFAGANANNAGDNASMEKEQPENMESQPAENA